MRRPVRFALLLMLTDVASAQASLSPPVSFTQKVVLNIASQPFGDALSELGRQTGLGIAVYSSVGRGITAPKLEGEYTPAEALTQILAPTELQTEYLDEKTAAVLWMGSKRLNSIEGYRPVVGAVTRFTEAEPPPSASSQPGQSNTGDIPRRNQEVSENVPTEALRKDLEEVVVTGTHIRGSPPRSTPLLVFTREDIERTGYTSTAQFMQSIPQNFGGIGAGTSGLASDNTAGNAGFGTAVDLRGLGFDSTLVLINGHRIAPAGSQGEFTDVSVIPLSAVKRIEILTDGASAIYGSDAIGGVANFVLRDDVQGMETGLEYGSTTTGRRKDYRATQSIGTSWSEGNGNAFLSYEFLNQSELPAADRSFSSGAVPADLLPASRQNSAYASLFGSLGLVWSLRGDAFFSDRSTDSLQALGTQPLPTSAATKQLAVNVETQAKILGDWVARIGAGYGENKTALDNQFGIHGGDSKLFTVDAETDGSIARLGGDVIRAAVGAQFRDERFDQTLTASFSFGHNVDGKRHVGAVFGEIAVPLVAESNRRIGIQSLDIDLASRYEHYSDFGSSFDPKFGVSWFPLEKLRVRGTASSSFKAPSFFELKGGFFADLVNSPDALSPSGRSAVLLLLGDNPQLKPETSFEWTTGIDLTPTPLSGFEVHATYYHIHFTDRIVAPGIALFNSLGETDLFGSFIDRNPSSAQVTQLAGSADAYSNITLIPSPFFGPARNLGDVGAIANNRLANISMTDVSGVDLVSLFRGHAPWFEYDAGLTGTYLFKFENTSSPGAPAIQQLSTLAHPINLRLRGLGSIHRGRIAGAIAINYQNHYVDSGSLPAVDIASWTTVDLHVRYHVEDAGRHLFQDLDFDLNCQNALNRNPPSVRNSSLSDQAGYDEANANPLGRMISVQVRKRW